MSEPKLPELATALRDHGSDERVERLWQRLESDLAVGAPRPRAALWWAPAAMVIVFGAGVFVGAHWRAHEAVGSVVPVLAEPWTSAEAAGTPQAALRPAPVAEPQHSKRERKLPVLDGTEEPAAEPVAPVVEVPMAAPVMTVPQSVTPEWERLANEGPPSAAYNALERQGGFDAALGRASAEQLMTLYEIALAVGHRPKAIQALRQVVDRYPADENAADAAYRLGNLLDKAGDKAGAAQAFADYRRLSPKGDFVEDALARQFDSAVERGDLPAARQYADQYAKEFPKGRRLAAIKKQLGKLSGAPQAAESVPEVEDTVDDEADEVPAPPKKP
jgi:TolA-binding protein